MNVWEGVALALTQIRTEKLKSFFSLLGVIIGVMFLIVVVSVVEGMDQYIKEDFASQIFGLNTITVTRAPSVQISSHGREARQWARRRRLSFEDAEAILAAGAEKISVNTPALEDPDLIDRLFDLEKVIRGTGDILKGPRPPSPIVPYSSVFNAPGRDSRSCECVCK